MGATPILCYVQIYAMQMWNLNKQNCICRYEKCSRPKIDYDVLMFRVLRAILTHVNCGNEFVRVWVCGCDTLGSTTPHRLLILFQPHA